MSDRPTPAEVIEDALHELWDLDASLRANAILVRLNLDGYRIVDADDATIAAEAPHSPATASEPPEGTTGPREPETGAQPACRSGPTLPGGYLAIRADLLSPAEWDSLWPRAHRTDPTTPEEP